MIETVKFDQSKTQEWNHFVDSAKNGHFMFNREYMEYHSDRFEDHSLLFFSSGNLIAILPANLADNILHSHQGLTFGGIISNQDMTTTMMLAIFDSLIFYLAKNNIHTLIYKHLPYIYSTIPAQEDLYALNVKGATLARVDVSSTIDNKNKLEFSSRRKRGIKKATKNNISVTKSQDYKTFHNLLSQALATRHNTSPTHSLDEIKLLAERFPNNISLYTATNNLHEVLAAVVIFEMNHWAHAQYIISSEEGKDLGALDLLFNELITNIYAKKRFFDFGISTESQGKILNSGLINQKEEFGGRAIVHNFFKLSIRTTANG